jgi:hypothetical protein
MEIQEEHKQKIDKLRSLLNTRTSPNITELWDSQEEEVQRQWDSLNGGARDVLAFMVRSGALPPETVFAYLNQQGYHEKVFRRILDTGLVLGLKDTYVIKFELKPYLERLIRLENSNPDKTERRKGKSQGWAANETESSAWDIRDQDAHRHWLQLNSAERELVKFVLVRGTASAAQIFTFAEQEGLSRASEIWARVMAKTGFILGNADIGFRINLELKPYREKSSHETSADHAQHTGNRLHFF